MYQQQQNCLCPKGDKLSEDNILKLMIGSQPIIEGRFLICGERG